MDNSVNFFVGFPIQKHDISRRHRKRSLPTRGRARAHAYRVGCSRTKLVPAASKLRSRGRNATFPPPPPHGAFVRDHLNMDTYKARTAVARSNPCCCKSSTNGLLCVHVQGSSPARTDLRDLREIRTTPRTIPRTILRTIPSTIPRTIPVM